MNLATVGVKFYPNKRLILNGNVEGVKYYKYLNWCKIPVKILHEYEVYYPLFQGHIDAYHAFNTIIMTHKPWCCTFETIVPRSGRNREKRLRYLLEVLSRDNCKKLISLSQASCNLQLNFLKKFPGVGDCIAKKTMMLKVPQPLLVDGAKDKVNEGKIKFFFVGDDFVRKGGPEIITALHRLHKKRQDFELVMITKLDHTRNYVFKNFQDSPEFIKNINALIEEDKDFIHMYPHMPFDEVKELMAKCDVGLLPTWADSYGFSVLEMQACGLPIITTDCRALPETNVHGWRIKLPKGEAYDINLKDANEKEEVRKYITESLYNIFDEILDNRKDVIERGQKSFDFIREVHSPALYTQRISEIYSTFGI